MKINKFHLKGVLMVELNRKKFQDAIFSFLSETMDKEKASNHTSVMVDNIVDTLSDIEKSLTANNVEGLSKKFHTLKNLLVYGDFYYESDLCQDIEMELKKNQNISHIISMYDELITGLKM